MGAGGGHGGPPDRLQAGIRSPRQVFDVAPAPDGSVWYTAQKQGALGRLDPATGRVEQIPLGPGSAPHGVIVGPDGAAWVTDSGLNAIVRVDPGTRAVRTFLLPGAGSANLNTASFDRRGQLWFTGQRGVYGRLDPRSGELVVWDSPRGSGPYGITTTPDGVVFYASLAGSHIARIDVATGKPTVIEPPTRGQGARRVWSDSKGRIWVSECATKRYVVSAGTLQNVSMRRGRGDSRNCTPNSPPYALTQSTSCTRSCSSVNPGSAGTEQ